MLRHSFRYEGKRYFIKASDPTDLAIKTALKKKALEEGTIVVTRNTTVSKWADEWLVTYKKGSVGESTYELYKTNLDKHIKPMIGTMKLKDVRPIHLQKLLNARIGHSRSHLVKIKQLLQQLFVRAKRNKLILDNPAEDLELPKASDGQRRSVTDKERQYILKVAETHKAGLWVKMMLYTGMRPGETATLQWKNVDLKKNVIKIDSARKAKTNEIGEPKSRAGFRKVPVPAILAEDLNKVKGLPFEYVFTQETTGKRHTKQSMYHLWKNFKREMNIAMGAKVYRNQVLKPYPVADDLIPYCLRHTYCTDLQAAGVPINVAKELMGHSSIEITSKIYTHYSDASFDNATDAINKFHAKKNPKTPVKKKLKSVHLPQKGTARVTG